MDVIEELRKEIDLLDSALIYLIAERQYLAKRIGTCKRQAGLPLWANKRVKNIIQTRTKLGKSLGLSKELVSRIFHVLIDSAMEEEKKRSL